MNNIFLFNSKKSVSKFIKKSSQKVNSSKIIGIYHDITKKSNFIVNLYEKDKDGNFIEKKKLFACENDLFCDMLKLQSNRDYYRTLSANDFWSIVNKKITITINELTEMLDIISILNNNFIYRGLSKTSYNLSPSLTRNNLLNENDRIEKLIFDDVTEFNLQIFKSQNFIEVASNMQHFGFPTRLMDWSTSPLHALYFACYGSSNTENAKVICLSKSTLYTERSSDYDKNLINDFLEQRYTNQISENLLEKLYTLIFTHKKNIVFINPANYNDRLKSQLGVFTLHINLNFSEFKDIFNKYIERNSKRLEHIIPKSDIKNLSDIFLSAKEFKNTKDLPSRINQLKSDLFERIHLTQKTRSIKTLDSKKIEAISYSFIQDLELLVTTTNQNLDQINTIDYLEFIIPKEKKMDFIKQLNLFGINSKTVYPDVKGYSQYIQEKYFTYKEALYYE